LRGLTEKVLLERVLWLLLERVWESLLKGICRKLLDSYSKWLLKGACKGLLICGHLFVMLLWLNLFFCGDLSWLLSLIIGPTKMSYRR
jgi:hypothetical protein